MSQEKTTLEVIAPTVEEAVQKGLAQLNLPEDAVEVEVLDAGSRGLFGLGSRQARIRLTIISQPVSSKVPSHGKQRPFAESPVVNANQTAAAPQPVAEQPVVEMVESGEPQDETLAVAIEVVSDLLEKTKVRARVSATYRPPEDKNDEEIVLVNVEGNDLSILIGRRSEVLNSLQYISSLIICKRLDRWVPIIIDVQGYRARRERQLRQIAQRMADQAIHTGRRQVLEPMPANERRLIHLELRDNTQVETESIGEEPNRKVTIILKK